MQQSVARLTFTEKNTVGMLPATIKIMGRVIAVANQKGGIGKTTTAVNMSFNLAEMWKSVLMIDTVEQCNSTDTCRAQVEGRATLYDLLFEEEEPKECIQHMAKMDVIASDKLLKNPETKFPDDATRLFTMRNACEKIRKQYDFIIIDTPPSLGCMLSNALTFADEVVIPVTCDCYGMEGISDLYVTISATKKYTNNNLRVTGADIFSGMFKNIPAYEADSRNMGRHPTDKASSANDTVLNVNAENMIESIERNITVMERSRLHPFHKYKDISA